MSKLVRDKIIEIKQKNGQNPEYDILKSVEYLQALKNKLVEESSEVAQTTTEEELLEELADLQEVMDCLLRQAKISKTQLKLAQIKKNEAKGSFKKRIFLK